MATEQEFRKELRGCLSSLEGDLVAVLEKLIAYDYPSEVFALCFEVFPDSSTSGFPVRAFFMDRDNCEYFTYKNGKAEYPSPVNPGLLDVEYLYPSGLEEKFKGLDRRFDIWKVSSNEIIVWFSECWSKAGGSSFALVATISEHDSSEELNLKTNEWQESYSLFAF